MKQTTRRQLKVREWRRFPLTVESLDVVDNSVRLAGWAVLFDRPYDAPEGHAEIVSPRALHKTIAETRKPALSIAVDEADELFGKVQTADVSLELSGLGLKVEATLRPAPLIPVGAQLQLELGWIVMRERWIENRRELLELSLSLR